MSQAFITRWNTTYNGYSSSNQIIIPATGTYQINWKEVANPSNTGSLNASGMVTVTFPNAGIYEVSITGGLTAITFNSDITKDMLKIISIEQWGNIVWTTMDNAFAGCSNMVVNATDFPNLTVATSLAYMFYNCASFNTSISNWDVSHITDMSFMFGGDYAFNQDLNAWNVSNVTDMSGMFYYAQSFNGNISSWNVSKVTTMRYMFATSPFNQDISNWDVSHVTNMEYMFNNAQAFNQNISGWDVSSVTNMGIMFSYATSFNQPIGNWNVSNVTEMEWMFSGATAFNRDLSLWNVSKVTVFYRMFSDASSFNQNLSSWDVSHATNMGFMLSNSGLSVVNYDALLNGWSSQSVQSGVPLGADNLKYCNATTVRNYLITAKGWIITGDALDCTSLGFENHIEAQKTTINPDKTPTCYPNPWNISENETLKVEGVSGDEICVTLSDIVGNIIYSKEFQLLNKEWTIPADAVGGDAKGAYVLKITSRKAFYIFTIIIR